MLLSQGFLNFLRKRMFSLCVGRAAYLLQFTQVEVDVERIAIQQMEFFIKSYISLFQHSFLKRRSTLTNLLELTATFARLSVVILTALNVNMGLPGIRSRAICCSLPICLFSSSRK